MGLMGFGKSGSILKSPTSSYINSISTRDLKEVIYWCDNTFGKTWYYDIVGLSMNNGFFNRDYSRENILSIDANVDIVFNFMLKEDMILFNLTWLH